MATWYVRELSKLMSVSVRTLHYYDKIGLLTPSGRLPNGYRVYSEADVIKLQKVVVLKFFGFTLSHVRLFLQKETDLIPLLRSQLEIIHSEVSSLKEAQEKLLSKVIADFEVKHEINWAEIVQLIANFTKTKELQRLDLEQQLSEGSSLTFPSKRNKQSSNTL
jgi:DNA-binding transcriptional MerR regulator